MAMRVYEVAHHIEHLLHDLNVPPECRTKILKYVADGIDPVTGEFKGHALDADVEIRCIDCEHKDGVCPPDCPVFIMKEEEPTDA